MGEAKRKGNFEERKAESIARTIAETEQRRKAQALKPPRVMGSPVLSLFVAGIIASSTLYK